MTPPHSLFCLPPSPEMAGAVNEATTEVARSLALCPWGAYPDLGMGAWSPLHPVTPLSPRTSPSSCVITSLQSESCSRVAFS